MGPSRVRIDVFFDVRAAGTSKEARNQSQKKISHAVLHVSVFDGIGLGAPVTHFPTHF